MKLTWSHAVMYVHNQEKMLKFYTSILGFEITDRGPLMEGAPEIIFLSNDPTEHHQLAMMQSREDEEPSNTINHFAFRVDHFEDVRRLSKQLKTIENVKIMPMSHGNTLSIYFNDPEGNGIEVFWDTPWHVAQPQGKFWDLDLDEADAVAWVESNFKDESTFEPREQYFARRRAVDAGE